MAGEGDGESVVAGAAFVGEVGVVDAALAVGVVFVAFEHRAAVVEQGRRAVEVVAGDVVGRGGIGRVGYHEEHLVQVVAVSVIALGGVVLIRFAEHTPAIVIIAGGRAVGNSLDASAQGVVGVVGVVVVEAKK